MNGGDPPELLAVVSRRADLLAAIRDGPLAKPDLESELAVSRSTIDRGVRELESMDLVERCEDGYRTTLAGRLALDEYDRFRERARGIGGAAGLLSAVAPDGEVGPAMLAGARVVEADRAAPHRPVRELYDAVGAAEDVRGFAPAVHPLQVETYCDGVRENGLRAELLLTDEALRRMVEGYGERIDGAVGDGGLTLLQAGGDLPYGLVVAETPRGPVAAVVVHADGGVRGCILNEAPDAVEWARRRYDRERERAFRVA